MSLITGFRECILQAGQTCQSPNGRLIREFGLQDFLENVLVETDDAPTITVKALVYFSQERDTRESIFRCAVLATGLFHNEYHAAKRVDLTQPLRDLLAILKSGSTEAALRQWVDSHF
jgi:hypothetical protein